uniref:Uncharacterized protein n=1 Tax=Glossina austeni TaxID=7395 RepID=A0A1A9V0L2_GLOAU
MAKLKSSQDMWENSKTSFVSKDMKQGRNMNYLPRVPSDLWVKGFGEEQTRKSNEVKDVHKDFHVKGNSDKNSVTEIEKTSPEGKKPMNCYMSDILQQQQQQQQQGQRVNENKAIITTSENE